MLMGSSRNIILIYVMKASISMYSAQRSSVLSAPLTIARICFVLLGRPIGMVMRNCTLM